MQVLNVAIHCEIIAAWFIVTSVIANQLSNIMSQHMTLRKYRNVILLSL